MTIKIEYIYFVKLRSKLKILIIFCAVLIMLLALIYYYLGTEMTEIEHQKSLIQNEVITKTKIIHDSWLKLETLDNTQNIISLLRYSKYQIIDTDKLELAITDLANYYEIDTPIHLLIKHNNTIPITLDKPIYLDNYTLILRLTNADDERILGFLATLINNHNLVAEIQLLEIKHIVNFTDLSKKQEKNSVSCLIEIKLQTLNYSPLPKYNDYSNVISYINSTKTQEDIERTYDLSFWKGSLIFDSPERSMQ